MPSIERYPEYKGRNSAAGAGALSLAWPTGHATDDIAILSVHTMAGEACSTPSGFNLIGSAQDVGSGVGSSRLTVFWGRATSGAMSNISIADSGDHQVANVEIFRYCVASGDPTEGHATNSNASSGTAGTAGAVTTTGTRRLIIDIFAGNRDVTGGLATAGTEANADLRDLSFFSNSGTSTNTGGNLAVTSGRRSPAGATAATTITFASSVTYVARSFALIGLSTTFPVIDGTPAQKANTGTVATHPFDLPAHDAGDLLVLIVGFVDGGTITDPAGWTQVYTNTNTLYGGRVLYRVSNGSEGSSVSFTTSSSCRSTGVCYVLRNGDLVEGTSGTGTGTNPDPPNLAPSWGSNDTLWLTALHANGGLAGIGAYPTNYDERQSRINTTATTAAGAGRYLTGSSEDPPTWTISSVPYIVGTIGVRPGTPSLGGGRNQVIIVA